VQREPIARIGRGGRIGALFHCALVFNVQDRFKERNLLSSFDFSLVFVFRGGCSLKNKEKRDNKNNQTVLASGYTATITAIVAILQWFICKSKPTSRDQLFFEDTQRQPQKQHHHPQQRQQTIG